MDDPALEVSPELRAHWRMLCKASRRSLTELSDAIGKDASYLSRILGPNGGEPGVFTAMRLAYELGISFEQLMNLRPSMQVSRADGYNKELHRHAERVVSDMIAAAESRLISKGKRPSIDEIVTWWHLSDGKLYGETQIDHLYDLVHPPKPEDKTVVPFRVGPESLAAEKLRTTDPQALARLVETFDDVTRARLVGSYGAADQKGQPETAIEKAEIDLPHLGITEMVDYLAVRLPVFVSDRSRFILSYCTPILERTQFIGENGFVRQVLGKNQSGLRM